MKPTSSVVSATITVTRLVSGRLSLHSWRHSSLFQNLCLNKAVKHGVRTAKLPIGRYLSNLPTRKVLTVNQCFEILLKWVETKDWEEALYSVIPKRKFQTGEKGSKATSGEAGDKPVEGEGEDDKGNEVTVVPEPSYGAEIQSDGGESS